VFLHELQPGPASKSYGVQVARLAGMPAAVLNHARHALSALEAGATESRQQVDLFAAPPESEAPAPSGPNPDALSPREALEAALGPNQPRPAPGWCTPAPAKRWTPCMPAVNQRSRCCPKTKTMRPRHPRAGRGRAPERIIFSHGNSFTRPGQHLQIGVMDRVITPNTPLDEQMRLRQRGFRGRPHVHRNVAGAT
jgi:hypothetical protein